MSTPSYCPVCNGLEELHVGCPECRKEADDLGRFNDFLGPYSPYRPIDEISLTNGFDDLSRHQCIHVLYCERCGKSFTVRVDDWT